MLLVADNDKSLHAMLGAGVAERETGRDGGGGGGGHPPEHMETSRKRCASSAVIPLCAGRQDLSLSSLGNLSLAEVFFDFYPSG